MNRYSTNGITKKGFNIEIKHKNLALIFCLVMIVLSMPEMMIDGGGGKGRKSGERRQEADRKVRQGER